VDKKLFDELLMYPLRSLRILRFSFACFASP